MICQEVRFMARFPDPDWIKVLMEKLNSDEKYGQVARNWEGDMAFVIEPGGSLTQRLTYYLDLWHGKCREAYVMAEDSQQKPVFTLRAP
jgi:hypothetical protein